MLESLYTLMAKYEKTENTYDLKVIDIVKQYFTDRDIPYSFDCSAWPNDEGAACAFAFVIEGKPRLLIFDVEG